MDHVIYKDKKYEIKNEKLNLSEKGIKNLGLIEGLKNNNMIKELYLWKNTICNLKEIEYLKNLEVLDIGNNQIAQIKGLYIILKN